MKTIREYLDMLPREYAELALANTIEQTLDTRAAGFSDALKEAFVWKDSPQGHDFWGKLALWFDYPFTPAPTIPKDGSGALMDSIKAIVERDGASTIELRLGNDTLIPHEWGLDGDKLWIELRRAE